MLHTEISKQNLEGYLKNVTRKIYINNSLYATEKIIIEIYAGDAEVGTLEQNEYYMQDGKFKVLEKVDNIKSEPTQILRFADDVLDSGAKVLNLPDDGRGWHFIFNRITLLEIQATGERFPGTQLFVVYE